MTWLLAHLVVVVVSALTAVAAASLLRSDRRSPQATLAWLLAVVLVPYVGLPLYLMLGGRKERRAALQFRALPEAETIPLAEASETDRLVRRYGLPGASVGNAVRILGTGEAAFAGLMEVAEGAERQLWAELFILGDDAVGRAFVEVLTEKAAQGLDVRLLLDAVGSRPLKARALAPFVEAGGHVARFEPVFHRPLKGRANLRDHRKLIVADGARAWAGGMNVAAEYLGPTPLPGRWRDLAFRLDGPAVAVYTALFRSDWAFASHAPLPPSPLPPAVGDAPVQVVPAGPDVPSDALYDLVLSLAFGARERLWLVTPYFVPDDALERAIAVAARRGVDVRLVVPDPSNHPLADLARGPALRALDAAGVRVLRHTAGMVHAKTLVADGTALVGSTNLDLRSLFLNAEVSAVFTGAAEVEAVAAWVDALGAASEAGTKPLRAGVAFAEGAARLVAPLL